MYDYDFTMNLPNEQPCHGEPYIPQTWVAPGSCLPDQPRVWEETPAGVGP